MTAVDGTGAAGTSAADALAERLFAATLGASELQSVYLGDRLGWYRALSDHGPLTSTELMTVPSGTTARWSVADCGPRARRETRRAIIRMPGA